MSGKTNYLAMVGTVFLAVGVALVYLKSKDTDNTVQSNKTNITKEQNNETNIQKENLILPEVKVNEIIVNEVVESAIPVVTPEIIPEKVQSDNDNLENEELKKQLAALKEEKENLLKQAALKEQKEKELLSEKNKKDEELKKLQEIALKKEAELKHKTEREKQLLADQAKKEADLKKAQQEIASKSQALKTEQTKIQQVAAKSTANICLSYGPMNIETKNKFLNLLESNKIASNRFKDFQLPQYEIYWNLGKNKLDALEKFEQQKKEGALKDERYRLTQDNESNWIVPATTIAGDYSIAERLAKQLSESSKKFGGVWNIREKVGGYYVSFPNASLISEDVLMNIDKNLRLNKTFC